jgi:membrane protease YdiL (CAAX protease family)
MIGVFFAIAAFLVPYTLGWSWGWWIFGASSLAIVLSLRLAGPKTFISELGIRMGKADVGVACLTLLIVGVVAGCVIPKILHQSGYAAGVSNTGKYLVTPFQVLNEEMVLRAFLLTILTRLVNRPIAISVAAAALFAVLHFFLYRFGPPNITLSIGALTTLFLMALAMNQFFFTTGNIAIPFGVHMGWNFTQFGSVWIARGSRACLPDGMDFNLIEGNFMVIALATALLALAIGANHILGDAPNFRKATLESRRGGRFRLISR